MINPSYRQPRMLFAMGAPVAGDTLTNPTSKTAFATTYTLPANSLAVGDVLEIHCAVFFDFTAATAFTWELAIGATTMAQQITGTNSNQDTWWDITFLVRVVSIGAAGTINWHGMSTNSATGAAVVKTSGGSGLAVALDTTAANAISLSVTNGSSNASNTDQMYWFTVLHRPA